MQHHCSRHTQTSYTGALATIGACLFGACTFDTTPGASPSRAPLEMESESEAVAMSASAAGAAAAAPAPAPPLSAAPAATAAAGAAAPAMVMAAMKEPEPKAPTPSQPDPEPAAPKAEAENDDAEACKPGMYLGVITGTVNFGPLEVGNLTGTINMRLVASEHNKQVLVVEQGRVEGIDRNRSKFAADVTGEVNCASGQLQESEVERGTYEDMTQAIKIGFTGEVKGRYSSDPPALLGTWNISDDTSLIAGQGTWTTALFEAL